MVELASLYYYPVKSLRGHELDSAYVQRMGLENDRRMMVVDPQGKFLTQRTLPRMALVVPLLNDDALTLTAPGIPDATIHFKNSGARQIVEVWRSSVEAVDQGEAAAEWLTKFLGKPVRLVRLADGFVRRVNPKYAATSEDRVSFADGYPLLLISEGSLDDLNARVGTPLPMNRFRPNVVVRGCAPFAEDSWKRIRVGEVEMAVVKPCARCAITTIDQESAGKSMEPLRTLATFRKVNGKVMFGQNVIPLNEGRIEVGASVEVIA
jgi:uncharacterized protein YcbX